MTWKLFLDDERAPEHVTWLGLEMANAYHNEEWVVARSFSKAIDIIHEMGEMPSFVSFDHDLGDDKDSGYDLAKWIAKADMYDEFPLPKDFAFVVHSKNPIGKKNIECYLENYLKMKNESA